MINKIVNRVKKSQLVKDSLWSLLGNVIGKGLALVAAILTARFLGNDVYGEYGIIRNTVLTIGVFSTFGLGYTATKYIAEFKKISPSKIPLFIKIAYKITILFSGLMAILLFISADYVARVWLEVNHLSLGLKILSVIIIFNAITTTQIGVLSGLGKFRIIARTNTIVGVLTFILSVLLTYYYSLNGALLALLIVQIANTLLNYIEVNKEVKLINKSEEILDKIISYDIIKFSTPIALQEAFYSLSVWLSSFFLVKFASYGDLGMYTAAMQWKSIIIFIPGILRNVILSHLAENNSDKNRHDKILKQTIIINIIATLLPCLCVYIFSSFIAKGYGQSFNGLESLISLACLGTIFMSVSNVYSQAYTSIGLNWLMFRLRIFRDFGILILAYLLLKFSKLDYSGAFILIVSGLILHSCFMVLMILFYNSKKKYYKYI